ncbi:MAG: carboxypeptidase-like regulatory domain-containing protein [Anaerolineales bacterium]
MKPCKAITLLLGVILFYACTVQGDSFSQPQYPSEAQSNEIGYPGMEVTSLAEDLSNFSCPDESPILKTNFGAVNGLIYQKSQNAVLSDMLIYLTPGQGENKDIPPPILAGPMEEKGDIVGKTDVNGCFYLNNVPPGNYYLVVALGYDYDIVVKSADDPTPLLLRIEPNQRLSLGMLILP